MSDQSPDVLVTGVPRSGTTPAVVPPAARDLRESLERRNARALCDRETILRIGERLLRFNGASWEAGPRESMEWLLAEVASAGLSTTNAPAVG